MGAKKRLSNECIAIIFINLYSVFNNFDNINVKVAQDENVSVMDLAFSRILLNFVAACVMVLISGKHVINDWPSNYKFSITYRSLTILTDQILNVYAISLLPIGIVTIL